MIHFTAADILPPALPGPDPTVLEAAVRADGFAEVGAGRRLKADVVVVGTGPGGAAVARAVAARGLSVVLLEEGPARSRFRPNQANTARYHMQEGGTMIAQGRAVIPIAAGRGVGGGSLINSALCFKTPPQVLGRWAEALDDDGWSAEALDPVYREISARIGVCFTPEEVAGGNNALVARGAAALGLEGGLAPRSTPGCRGCGVCNFGCPSGGKASMNLNLLPDAVAAGAQIQAEVRVDAVLVEGGAAVGVRGHAVHPDTGEVGGPVEVRAGAVVLSAGAVGTPRLLWSCGLAPDLGPVGEGLHIHPGSGLLGVADEPIYMWRGATQGAFFLHPELPGALPHTFSAPPEVALLATGHLGPKLQEGLKLLPYLCGALLLVSDQGHGRVRATSDGRADLRYDFAEEDVAMIKRGLLEVGRVLLAGGARELFAPVFGVGRHRSLESLAAALDPVTLRDFSLYASHPMSTCRMGRDPETSVLDASGRAHRLPGLLIADASVFPTSLGVNPQLTTMVAATIIGRRLAAPT